MGGPRELSMPALHSQPCRRAALEAQIGKAQPNIIVQLK